jgi:bifunctional DNA-binding transcriptional regulator/antitoxin component of YhaV-PrlF toxin-antitoxin module
MAIDVKRRRDQTRLSSKHQVTIPIDVIREAGLKVGDELRVWVDQDRRIVLTRVNDVIERFAGSMAGIWPDGWLDDLRDEWR